jgi:aminoglycoside 6'-N-acetyltransferase
MSPSLEPLPRTSGDVMLRRLSSLDLAAFQAYRRDPVVGRYQSWVETTDADADAFLREMSVARLLEAGEWCQIAIAHAVDGRLLGDIGLCLAKHGKQVEVGFTLAREAQGRGVAAIAVREAIRLVFELTGAERVVGITDSRNAASIRLLERVGMRRVASEATTFRGEPCVEHTYAIAR